MILLIDVTFRDKCNTLGAFAGPGFNLIPQLETILENQTNVAERTGRMVHFYQLRVDWEFNSMVR